MKKLLKKIAKTILPITPKNVKRCDDCIYWHDHKDKSNTGYCSALKIDGKLPYSGFDCESFKAFK